MRLHAFLLLWCLPMTPLAGAGQTLSPRDIVGCYDIRMGAWNPSTGQAPDSLRHLPPPRVSFDTLPLVRRAGGTAYAVSPAPGSRPSRHRYSFWGIEGDRVRASWSTGFVGVTLDLGRDGNLLSGFASTFTDVRPSQTYRAEVRAEPVSCDTPPEFPLSESQLLIRAVPLASGRWVELGNPLPTSEEITERSSEFSYILKGPAVGAFEGGDLVRASVNGDGLVEEIRVEYPPGTDFDSLIERLEVEMGVPGKRNPRARMPFLSWEDWLTSVTVTQIGDRIILMFVDPRLG
jgi:hypothetical protein